MEMAAGTSSMLAQAVAAVEHPSGVRYESAAPNCQDLCLTVGYQRKEVVQHDA
jgi:hypothetical protein